VRTPRSVRDADVSGKRVLVRADLNVPLEDGRVADDTRIRASLPTLEWLLEHGAAHVRVCSHLGRPKGGPDPKYELEPVRAHLRGLLDDERIEVLENTRFDPRETENDEGYARELAEGMDIYVNDAFGSAHRAHASTAGVAEVVRERGGLAVAGHLMEQELAYLGRALDAPVRPFVAILGGAKISGKIDVIEALLPKVDRLLIGGAMANTFFRAAGLETGSSLVEEDRMPLAKELMERGGEKLVLPVDLVVAPKMEAGAETKVVAKDAIPAGYSALDVGPETVKRYAEIIRGAKTVLWNGPMGVFEIEEFRKGTEGVARALTEATSGGATTVVGGGDSAAAIAELGLSEQVSHVSTGGGASLEFLEGKVLPGVEALSDREGAK